MFLHNKRMMYAVRVDEPNPQFAKMLLEQFGGPNGELAAAMRYFTQAWADPDPARRDMLLDIATEELSHLEMVGQTLVQLLKGSPGAEVDEVEGGYLGKLLDGKHETFVELSLTSGPTILEAVARDLPTPWVRPGRRPTSTASASRRRTCARTSPPRHGQRSCTSG